GSSSPWRPRTPWPWAPAPITPITVTSPPAVELPKTRPSCPAVPSPAGEPPPPFPPMAKALTRTDEAPGAAPRPDHARERRAAVAARAVEADAAVGPRRRREEIEGTGVAALERALRPAAGSAAAGLEVAAGARAGEDRLT